MIDLRSFDGHGEEDMSLVRLDEILFQILMINQLLVIDWRAHRAVEDPVLPPSLDRRMIWGRCDD